MKKSRSKSRKSTKSAQSKVRTASNGAPYVKGRDGRVRFISHKAAKAKGWRG